MEFKMPVAKRERLEELLEYLGERAEDFRKCFDVESEWCWKYADLALRGIEHRDLGYSERHHIVPASFYGKRGCRTVDHCNITVFSYMEHVWAHYFLVWCATGKMQGKMVKAFITMYNVGMSGKRPLIPSEAELLAAIPEMELRRIRAMEPQWVKVEAEGRTHHYEDPKQYDRDYYEANKEKFAEQGKAYYEANKEKRIEYRKNYYEANKEKIAEKGKAYYEANREKIAERKKARYEANKEKIAEQQKTYYEANREKIAERGKARYEANKEKRIKQQKAYYEANKEMILEKKKARFKANREKLVEQRKAYYEAKKAAGYRYRKNPVTGKNEWVFVGLPENSSAA